MLDAKDIALLNLLQDDALATADALSEEVALSPSAIARRLRRMRADGTIAASHVRVAGGLTEHYLRAVLHIRLTSHPDLEAIGALVSTLRAADEVQLVLELAGPVDLLALVVCRNMAHFNRFAEAHLESAAIVQRFETSVVKRVAKQVGTVRLQPADASRG